MFRHVSQSGPTLGNIGEKHRETSNVSEFAIGNILLPGKEILFPQQCFTYGHANVETFEETLRITNVSATMLPSLPCSALEEENLYVKL
jgi:hypothetical protein